MAALFLGTRPSSRSLQQACRQPVVECRRQAASQMRSRGMLRPVVTWLLQSVVRSATNCCDRTAAALLETDLLQTCCYRTATVLLWTELQQVVVNKL